MNDIYYSIIIPHRNIPNLLRRLLASIPNRDDVQIIVVDDNSSKENVAELKKIEKENEFIKIIYLSECNGGGYARNIGLKSAVGKWVLFADSDDFFNYCINDIFDDYKTSEADIVYFNANSVDCELYTTAYRTRNLSKHIEKYEFNKKGNEDWLRYKFGEPWCKLVKRNVIKTNNIKFEETTIHNDTAYSYLVGYYSRNMIVDKRALYCVTERMGSVSVSLSETKKLERIGVFARSSSFFRHHNLNVTEDWHFKQLFESKKENENTYNSGFNLLIDLGYTKKEIKKALIKQFFLHIKQNLKKPIRLIFTVFGLKRI